MLKKNKITGRFEKGNCSGRRFTAENSIGNQYAKGNPKNRTTWRDGDTEGKKHPQWKGGVQYCKKDCVHLYVSVGLRERRPRKVWEENFGKIPVGFIIWHLNGDKCDDRIQNLECISRAECVRRNRRKEL
jgi:hypothetical protein